MKLNSDNYFSTEMQMKYMGVSQYKAFEKCPACALAEIKEEFVKEKTTSLLIGSYVDAYFEGSMKQFCLDNPQIFRFDGMLKAEYRKANEIIKRIERDKLFMKLMSGKKQVIMTGAIAGVPIKIKIDSLLPDMIVDLKIMKDFEPLYVFEKGKLPWYEAWRYDLQGAVYQEIYRQNTGEVLPFVLAGATKEPVTDIQARRLKDEFLQFELGEFEKNVPYFNAVKQGVFPAERCEKCDYCKETKVLTEIIQTEELLND